VCPRSRGLARGLTLSVAWRLEDSLAQRRFRLPTRAGKVLIPAALAGVIALTVGLTLTATGLAGIVYSSGLVAPDAALAVLLFGVAPLAGIPLLARWLRTADTTARRAVTLGTIIGFAAFLAFAFVTADTGGRDAWVYYSHRIPDPYDATYQQYGFAYSPAFAQVVALFHFLPWPIWLVLWSALLLLVLLRLTGPIAVIVLVAWVVPLDIEFGNVNLILAGAIVYGFRWPALWSIVLLTKVTPGIGLLWFAVRGEWRRLGVALGATGAIIVVSFLLTPDLWAKWVSVLAGDNRVTNAIDAGPLFIRLPIAGLVVTWGARHSKPWTVPIASTIALPVLWPAALSMLVAVIPLARTPVPGRHSRAVDWALEPSFGSERPGTHPSPAPTDARV
jgi:hypothetical protein